MPAFTTDRTLLNPRFDGYKFSPLDLDEVASRYPLNYELSQKNVSGRTPLSFQEVQSRVLHNHLTICNQSRRAVYVDAEMRVIGIDIDEITLRPMFSILFEIPKPIHSADAYTLQREYPSAEFIDTTSVFVSDGHGSLYVLRISQNGPADLLATYELSIPAAYQSSQTTVPVRLHRATVPDSHSAVLLLSSKHYPRPASQEDPKFKPPPVHFDIWAVQLQLPIISSSDVQQLHIIWHRRGDDVPVYTAYDSMRNSFVFVGTSAYLPITLTFPETHDPSPDELAPIPRAGETLDGSAGSGDTSLVPKPPPYSWTQNSDSVTLAIPLPADTPTSHIKVTFSPKALTLIVEGHLATAESPIVAPRYTLKTFWDGIQPTTSLWTFDRAAESRYGILMLHLDKQHEGTRWPQCFAAPTDAGSRITENGQEEEEVPETLDPSELYNIREALEKYTSSLRQGVDAGGPDVGAGVPSLADGERDDEVDLSIGKSVCVTWVRADGADVDASASGHRRMDNAPLRLLSTPFPGAAGSLKISLVAKHGLDGVVITLKEAGSDADGLPIWEHTSTYSALAFVLASKRDTRFVHHLSSKAVFAFESGAQDLGGNVYIYRGTGPKENWAKQTVLKLGGGSAGSLLGVGMMDIQGRTVILCLCEGDLTILCGVV